MASHKDEALDLQDIPAIEDLSSSGLNLDDINGRMAGGPEKAAVGAPSQSIGYVIPYYSLSGESEQFYRVKMLSGDDPKIKYRQTIGTANHIYFPPAFKQVESLIKQNRWNDDDPRCQTIIITEGEKKAARAVKAGFRTVALGGVDNWRTRNLLFPKDTKVKTVYGNRGGLQIRLPQGSEISENWMFARGLEDLITYTLKHGLHIVMVFDSDESQGLKYEVQQASAILGYALRASGIPSYRLRRAVLPTLIPGEKMGLDDYLEAEGADALEDLLEEVLANPHSCPTHPNPRGYINKKLNQGGLKRKDAEEISFSILTELDAQGARMYNIATGLPYYFDNHSLQLMPADLLHKHGSPMHETKFGQFLYRKFGVNSADSKLLSWLAAQLTGEHPTYPVDPRRTVATLEDGVAIQISDSEFIKVSHDPMIPFEVCNNGTEGVLFEQDQVEPVDGAEIIGEAMKELKSRRNKTLKPHWQEVMRSTNIAKKTDQDIAALLFYISPWLLRWRGIQLPVEVYTGPPGSGKSSLAALRLEIMTGRQALRNIPNDIKDWYSSVGSSGGLHVIDNVHLTNRDLRQRLSDEICRIITEPDPHVEMRQLYTTADTHRIPVRCTFAFTALQPPFQNSDFLQRSVLFELERPEDSSPDSEWVSKQLNNFGGREQWLAHHIVFLHRFLRGCVDHGLWDTEIKVQHRLVHFELAMSIAAKVLGMEMPELGSQLSTLGEGKATEIDWALEGLKSFACDAVKRQKVGEKHLFASKDVAEWAYMHPDFEENAILANSRKCGRYMLTHSSTISKLLGIKDAGKKNNRQMYYVSEYAKNLLNETDE